MFEKFVIKGPFLSFVKTSANIFLVSIYSSFTFPFSILSLSKKYLIDICFNFGFISSFSILVLLAILSVKILIGFLNLNNYCNMFLIHKTFLIHSDVLMYSASAVDVATIDCFLLVQQIGLLPIKIIFPDVDFLSLISPAKSASVYPIISPLPS